MAKIFFLKTTRNYDVWIGIGIGIDILSVRLSNWAKKTRHFKKCMVAWNVTFSNSMYAHMAHGSPWWYPGSLRMYSQTSIFFLAIYTLLGPNTHNHSCVLVEERASSAPKPPSGESDLEELDRAAGCREQFHQPAVHRRGRARPTATMRINYYKKRIVAYVFLSGIQFKDNFASPMELKTACCNWTLVRRHHNCAQRIWTMETLAKKDEYLNWVSQLSPIFQRPNILPKSLGNEPPWVSGACVGLTGCPSSCRAGQASRKACMQQTTSRMMPCLFLSEDQTFELRALFFWTCLKKPQSRIGSRC